MTLGIGLIIAAIAALALVLWIVRDAADRAHTRIDAMRSRLDRDFTVHQEAMSEAVGRIEDLSTAQAAMVEELEALKTKPRRKRKSALEVTQ